jgi:hypothetical protein
VSCDRTLRIYAPRDGNYIQLNDVKVQVMMVLTGAIRKPELKTFPGLSVTYRLERLRDATETGNVPARKLR